MEYTLEDKDFQRVIVQSAKTSREGIIANDVMYDILNGFCLIYSGKPWPIEYMELLNDPFAHMDIVQAFKWAQGKLERDTQLTIMSYNGKLIDAWI